MTTEIRVPIIVKGWITLRDLKVTEVELDRYDWEYSRLPYVSEYGADPDVVVFRDHSNVAGYSADRIEGDVEITERVHELIGQKDISSYPWRVGAEKIEPA